VGKKKMDWLAIAGKLAHKKAKILNAQTK
jgi:hypothetical protein